MRVGRVEARHGGRTAIPSTSQNGRASSAGAKLHARVKRWLRRHPQFPLHSTPTASSWLNLVERWFRDLTDKRIRRESFDSVPDLIAVIEDYLMKSNQNPHIFVWTASVDRILAKFAKCKEALETLH